MAAAGRSVLLDTKEKNPFALPSDEDLFTNREKARAATMEVCTLLGNCLGLDGAMYVMVHRNGERPPQKKCGTESVSQKKGCYASCGAK
jgi:hypothetical protein